METDDKRAVFLAEFDALADYVSPVEGLSPIKPAVETADA